MKRIYLLAPLVVASLAVAAPAHAQLGGILNKANKAKETADKLADLNMSDADERKLGEQVSQQLRERFGVYQNADVTKYVSLVGTVIAQASSRPSLKWEFVVLDTDGVNAYAAPGGIVHITRGLLGLIKNEAELADVLGHEITHITAKHTVKAIQKAKAVQLTADETKGNSLTGEALSKLADAAYHILYENKYDRDQEKDADRTGVTVAAKVGYSPTALIDVLKKLDARNTGAQQPNGLFASHPDTQSRIDEIQKTIREQKLTASATVAARYKKYIDWDAKAASEITSVDAGAKGLAGGSASGSNGDKDKKDDGEPKKKGGFLKNMGLSGGQQAQSTQTVSSAGGRAIGNDNNAKGGGNPRVLGVTITPAELDAFKKGING